MAISQKLHTKLVQKLILTPSLQQAIKLLPMSTLELSELLNQEMVENPMLEEVPTEELQPVEAATTIRVRGGKLSTTDGPFAETKEQLGGFLLIEARDLNEALQVAGRIPMARRGTIEVRPIKEIRR